MSVTLVATVGGSGSNSFQTADGVQAILDGVRNADAWDAIRSDDDKDTICVEATTMLTVMSYRGQKVSSTQALAFPRFGLPDPDYGDTSSVNLGTVGAMSYGVYLDSTTIPARILRAHAMLCLEIARAGTSDVWGQDATLDVVRKKVDVLETEYAPRRERRTGLRLYPSVWREIAPLLMSATSRTVERA